MVKSKHTHPKPIQNKLAQYGALALASVMLITAPLQVLLVFLGAPGGLFVLSALITLLLIPPVLMVTTLAPTVTVHDAGLTVEPLIWPIQEISWDQVQAVKEYPLLPGENQEVTRRMIVGRRNYRPAEGIMLVVDGLPVYYGIAAFFAGESGRTVLVMTSRSYTEYARLKKKIVHHAGEVQPYD